MKMIPIEDRVLLTPLDASDVTSGGVILPDMNQEGAILAKVIAVGPGRMSVQGNLIKTVTSVGDVVLAPKFGSVKAEIEGEEYLVCREGELITILEDYNG